MPRNRKVVADDALTPPLVVLRKIDLKKFDRQSLAILSTNAVRHQGMMYSPVGASGNSITEGELPWFADGFILNDHPRIFDLTKEIMNATLGFAVARTDSGTILAEFDGLKDAEAAVARATMQLFVDVNLPSAAKARAAKAEAS